MKRLSFAAGAAVLAALVLAPAASAITSGVCDTDGGVRVRVCVYQDASVDYTSGGSEYIDVTDYRVRVTNLDTHNVTLSSALLRATVKSSAVSQTTSKTFSSISSGSTYQLNVPWHNTTTRVTRDGFGYQAGNALVTYYFRGSKQTFQTSNVCAGFLPGGSVSSCNS